MTTLDYLVMTVYFLAMAGIGVWAMRRVNQQEDFFLGGRSFGKLMQTFAAFGAGTGSSDPVNTARTTFTGGMSGMWSIMSWLFVTPLYWIAGVWYRRMRHVTLGDWFVERYQSPTLGAAYALFGLLFYIVYTAMLFTATVKFAAPLLGDTITVLGQTADLEYFLVPVIALIVVIYGVAGGLTAAYWTDLIQGIFIILLSMLLIPFGLQALVAKYGDPATQSTWDGFAIMHEQVPDEMFRIVGATGASEFPLSRIVVVALMVAVGAVVMPHFIASGGGSAKTELDARSGLVIGNLLKRFCTIGWALTALILLALLADNPILQEDPDKVWGIGSLELLPSGLRGLMLACVLAALMGSADTYMIVCAGLIVRNLIAPFRATELTDRQGLLIGRLSGGGMIVGAVVFSWLLMDVFRQLQLTWIVPMLFAAPFWVGMYWRRATKTAAWLTIAWCGLTFFVVPSLLPLLVPGMRTASALTDTNQLVVTVVQRPAAPADVARRAAAIELWQREADAIASRADPRQREQLQQQLVPRPQPLEVGGMLVEESRSGGAAIFWTGGVVPVDPSGEPMPDVQPRPVGEPQQTDPHTVRKVLRYEDDVRLAGRGNFRPDFLIYRLLGMDLTSYSAATLNTLEFPPKIIMPFLIMIVVSLVTRPGEPQALDRYYAKMKTPVQPDPTRDREALEQAYADPDAIERKKLFPGTSLEFQRPNACDVVGVVACFAACFAIIWLAVLVAGIGS
jgi:SSS family solute:Na+ symporter